MAYQKNFPLAQGQREVLGNYSVGLPNQQAAGSAISGAQQVEACGQAAHVEAVGSGWQWVYGVVQRIKQGAGHGAAQAHGSSIGRGVGAAIERRWPGLDDNRTEIEVVPQAQVGGLRAFQIVFAPKVDTGQQRGQREPAPAVPTLGSTAHWSMRAGSL